MRDESLLNVTKYAEIVNYWYYDGVHSRERNSLLIENIARLKRAERATPRDRDIAEVRFALESELGETVGVRAAARFMDVSHTALGRWIEAGDVPTVFTAKGRSEVPVSFLLRLREEVDEERRSARRKLHVLESVMQANRRRAEEIDVSALVGETQDETDPHDKAAIRSLAYHRVLAARLNRAMVNEAVHVCWKWRAQGKLDSHYADIWDKMLSGSVSEVRAAIAQDSESARDLRQNTLFAGMLSEPERRKIIEAIT